MGKKETVVKASKVLPKRFLSAGKDFYSSYKTTQHYGRAMCVLFDQNTARIIPATITKNAKEVIPKGTNMLIENKNQYHLIPDNLPFFVCHVDNVHTIKVDDEPEEQTIDKMIEGVRIDEKTGKVIKTISIEKFTQKGARFLNERGYDLTKTALLRFMETHGNMQTILIIIASGLFGAVVMAVIMAILFA